MLIASPFEDYCRSDGKGSFISDGYEVYVSRFGLCAETAGAWLEETICVNECSTELFVGCVMQTKETSASALRRCFHGVAVTVKEKVVIRMEAINAAVHLLVRTKSQVLYDEQMSVATTFPGRRAHQN